MSSYLDHFVTVIQFRSQLCVLLEHVVKLDFPDKWTGVVDDVLRFLSANTQEAWLGGTLSLYQVAKKYK